MELVLRQLIANTQHDFQRFLQSPEDNNLKVCQILQLKWGSFACTHACMSM